MFREPENEEIAAEINSHLACCPSCRLDFERTREVWNLMGRIPQSEPSVTMKDDFAKILSEFALQEKESRNLLRDWIVNIKEFWFLHASPRLAFGTVLTVAALITGYLLHQPKNADPYLKQIDSLSRQVSEIKQVMMFSMLDNPSASQRIRAVGYAEEIGNTDGKVIDALFTTLEGDPDVNVRLVTLEALVRFSGKPEVRERLVMSISRQDSPFMQAAIADVMVRLQEKSSVPSLKKLLGKKDLNNVARVNIQKSLNKLI